MKEEAKARNKISYFFLLIIPLRNQLHINLFIQTSTNGQLPGIVKSLEKFLLKKLFRKKNSNIPYQTTI